MHSQPLHSPLGFCSEQFINGICNTFNDITDNVIRIKLSVKFSLRTFQTTKQFPNFIEAQFFKKSDENQTIESDDLVKYSWIPKSQFQKL